MEAPRKGHQAGEDCCVRETGFFRARSRSALLKRGGCDGNPCLPVSGEPDRTSFLSSRVCQRHMYWVCFPFTPRDGVLFCTHPRSSSAKRVSAWSASSRGCPSGSAGWAQVMRVIKPIERLVSVSYACRHASTSDLSTLSSTTALKGELVSRWVSRLDAFSGYPFRT